MDLTHKYIKSGTAMVEMIYLNMFITVLLYFISHITDLVFVSGLQRILHKRLNVYISFFFFFFFFSFRKVKFHYLQNTGLEWRHRRLSVKIRPPGQKHTYVHREMKVKSVKIRATKRTRGGVERREREKGHGGAEGPKTVNPSLFYSYWHLPFQSQRLHSLGQKLSPTNTRN